MAKPQQIDAMSRNRPSRTELKHEKDHSLKGTFVSVMFLGTFVLLTWIGVFLLFLSRS